MAETDPVLVTEASQFTQMLGELWGFATSASRSRGDLPVLPPSQARALRLIVTGDSGITPTRLAVQMGLSRPMVSEVVRKLEENLLVERRRSRADGRSVVVTATERGLYVHRSFRLGLVDSVAEAFGSMTHGDVRRIMDCMPAFERLHEQLLSIAEREESAAALRTEDGTVPAADSQV